MKHYVYRHIREDINMPFYIGIGSKRKGFTEKSEYFRANDFNRRSVFWKKTKNKCDNISIEILFESDDRNLIEEKEREFIALYGRVDLSLGTLVNLTDGGDGACNVIRDEEYINKQRLAKLGKKQSKETIEKATLARRGYRHSEETILKMKVSALGNKRSLGVKRTEEQKKKLSDDRKGKWGVGSKHSKETIEKMTSSRKLYYLNNPIISDEIKSKVIELKLMKVTIPKISSLVGISGGSVKRITKAWRAKTNIIH